jgi:signal transduction histidine kinase
VQKSVLGPSATDRREDGLVRSLLTGIAVFRWLAWAWMVVLLAVNSTNLREPDARPWVAIGLVAAALAATAGTTLLLRSDPARLLTLPVVAAELAVGFALEVGDKVAYNGVSHSQSLPSAWPLAAIMTAGIAFAFRGGMIAGAVVGLGRAIGGLLDPTPWTQRDGVGALSTIVLYALAGGVAGYVTGKLREAERRISLAQAREEIARTLHDGVLQTLAIVQRRTPDPELGRLAHEQERELREFLYDTASAVGGGGDLGTRLRAAAARFEDRYGGTARVVIAADAPALPARTIDALAGAVGEALANAGKHGGASTVTVFSEPVDLEASLIGEAGARAARSEAARAGSTARRAIFCSVKDDGLGFDPAAMAEGSGLRHSVRGRIAEVGGRVEIDGLPGRGTEVRCWVPLGRQPPGGSVREQGHLPSAP